MNIFEFLVPREERFFDMLCDQAANTLDGALVFREYIHSFGKLSREQREATVSRIKEIEHRGDRIIYAINERLNHTLITPLDKEDIHELANLLDDVLDLLDKVARQTIHYRVKKVDAYLFNLAECIVMGMQHTQRLMGELRRLRFPRETARKVHELESKADTIYCAAMANLFARSTDPVEIIKLKDLYQSLEVVTDKIKDVSVIIENVVIKHA